MDLQVGHKQPGLGAQQWSRLYPQLLNSVRFRIPVWSCSNQRNNSLWMTVLEVWRCWCFPHEVYVTTVFFYCLTISGLILVVQLHEDLELQGEFWPKIPSCWRNLTCLFNALLWPCRGVFADTRITFSKERTFQRLLSTCWFTNDLLSSVLNPKCTWKTFTF